MSARIEAGDLAGLGFTEQEIQAVLASASAKEQIRLLRGGRGRILDEVHSAQQRLDRLDYMIYQIRQEGITT